MKKNKYGNIEDIVQNVRMITSKGTFEKKGNWPRVSNGFGVDQLMLGSEGNFGIITDAVIKIKKIPEITRFGSVLFPDLESGI